MNRKTKHKIIFATILTILFGVILMRAVEISRENARIVFNPARAHATYGVPVETMIARITNENLYEPVAVRGGRIYVSAGRVGLFRVGQNLSTGGRITSVSNRIDLHSGMFVMRTNAPDGNAFVQIPHRGIFVPLYALRNNEIMLAHGNVAVATPIEIIARDASRAVIRGIDENNVIILTRVDTDTKIRAK